MRSTNLKPNHRILIVDDTLNIHADFREILSPRDVSSERAREIEATLFQESPEELTRFELDSAYQGQQALAMVEQSLAENRPYAMAFVDIRMPPGWDGVETIARIWEIDPELQIVICTAFSDYTWAGIRAKVRQPDSLLIIKKPFDNMEVRQLAHALTKKWQLNRQTRLQLEDLAQSNELLARSEETFSKAFHESPLPSAIQSFADQRFLDANERFAEMTGYTRQEIVGRTPAELRFWENPQRAAAWYDRAMRKELVRDQKTQLRNRSGELREAVVSLSPIALNQQPHVLLLAEDVSEKILLEQQLRQAQKMEAIGQLAAGVAHDFNNILTVIQGYSGLMQQDLPMDNRHAKALRGITNATSRATSLIRQLLMFSRKQVMQFRFQDLNQVLIHSINMLERVVGEHVNIQFRPQNALPAIHADTSMLEQIAMNLAVNARDAMPNGGKLTIATAVETLDRQATAADSEPRKGRYVCLTFQDTGTGMDPEVLNRIFEPFFTTKPVGKGTGLGLSTVFGIVHQHGGWLEVDSALGKGTTFRIYFPPTGEVVEQPTPTTETAPVGGHETILLAEDEDALREMVAEILRLQGYHVLEARSGQHALEVWEQADRPIDLLLTDLVMPGGVMGGELADRLSSRNPNLRVIYTSGYSPGMAGRDISLLANRNFLAKPYSISKLAQSIRECLDAPAPKSAPGETVHA